MEIGLGEQRLRYQFLKSLRFAATLFLIDEILIESIDQLVQKFFHETHLILDIHFEFGDEPITITILEDVWRREGLKPSMVLPLNDRFEFLNHIRHDVILRCDLSKLYSD